MNIPIRITQLDFGFESKETLNERPLRVYSDFLEHLTVLSMPQVPFELPESLLFSGRRQAFNSHAGLTLRLELAPHIVLQYQK